MHHLFLSPATFPHHTFLSSFSLPHSVSPSLSRRRFTTTTTVFGPNPRQRPRFCSAPAPHDHLPSALHHDRTIKYARLNSPSLSLSSPRSLDQIPRSLSFPVPLLPSLSRLSLPYAMATSPADMEPLTSGASNRIIPIVKALRSVLVFVYAFMISLLASLLPRRRRRYHSAEEQPSPARKRKSLWKMEEEDTMRRRTLAEGLEMGFDNSGDDGREPRCRWGTSLFFGVRHNALFCRSWIPVSGELK